MGAVFVLWGISACPLLKKVDRMSSETTESFEAPPHKIMLISDSQVDTHLIERKFMDIGSMACQLYSCPTLEKAMEYIEQRKLITDVVILDLSLRGVDDPVALCKQVVAMIPGVPVLALDKESADEVALEKLYIEAGVTDYIHRNQFDELFVRIKKLIHPNS